MSREDNSKTVCLSCHATVSRGKNPAITTQQTFIATCKDVQARKAAAARLLGPRGHGRLGLRLDQGQEKACVCTSSQLRSIDKGMHSSRG